MAASLIIDHPFQPGQPPLQPEECGYRELAGGLPCGYDRTEHADQGNEGP